MIAVANFHYGPHAQGPHRPSSLTDRTAPLHRSAWANLVGQHGKRTAVSGTGKDGNAP